MYIKTTYGFIAPFYPQSALKKDNSSHPCPQHPSLKICQNVLDRVSKHFKQIPFSNKDIFKCQSRRFSGIIYLFSYLFIKKKFLNSNEEKKSIFISYFLYCILSFVNFLKIYKSSKSKKKNNKKQNRQRYKRKKRTYFISLFI